MERDNYATRAECRGKIEDHFSTYDTRVKIVPEDCEAVSEEVARFAVRGDRIVQDSDYVTWSGGPVLRVPLGLTREQAAGLMDTWRAAYDKGREEGREALQEEIKSVLGVF